MTTPVDPVPCRWCGAMKRPDVWCKVCIYTGRADLAIIRSALMEGRYSGDGDPYAQMAKRVYNKLRDFGRLTGEEAKP